jgi:hypothetical protein
MYTKTELMALTLISHGFDVKVSRIEWTPLSVSVIQKRAVKSETPRVVVKDVRVTKPTPYMTDEEVRTALRRHDEDRYHELPQWLKHELAARELKFGPRQPSVHDMRDSEFDHRLHRYYGNTLNATDLHSIYVKGVKYDV